MSRQGDRDILVKLQELKDQGSGGGGTVTGSSLTSGNLITGAGGSAIQDSGTSIANLNITSIKDGTDTTKVVNFDVSGVATATTRTVTFPNANTNLPVATQTLTISGPTAARTITLPDASFTAARTDAANTFTGVQTMTSPVFITPALGTPASGNLVNCTGAGLSAATGAQAVTGTSTAVALTPANNAQAVFSINSFNLNLIVLHAGWGNAAVGGTGTNAFNGVYVDQATGATGSSWAVEDTNNNIIGLCGTNSALTASLNFDKPIGFNTDVRIGTTSTNTVARFSMGNTVAANGSGNTGKLAGKGIGFEIRNATFFGAVHDGTTYNSATLGATATINAYNRIACFRSGSGSYDFYVNGVFAATVTGGPTGTNSSHVSKVFLGIDNGGDANNSEWFVGNGRVFGM